MAPVVPQYLVFAGEWYYPSGGWEDYIGSFELFEDADACAQEQGSPHYAWSQVVDIAGEQIVRRYEAGKSRTPGTSLR